LLRYSLYDTKEKVVSLEKEIQYIENYVSLEKIRLEDQTEIQFITSGDFTHQKIAPMLLIVFVENAFKHLGVSKNNKNSVVITVLVSEETLTFTCTNTVDKTKTKNLESGKSGIGLQNAKKRLDLLYSNKHQLEIIEKEEKYTVNLLLNL